MQFMRTKYVKKKVEMTTAIVSILGEASNDVYKEVSREEISIPGKLSEDTLTRVISRRVKSPFKIVSFETGPKYYQCTLDRFLEIAEERGPLRTVKPKTTD